MYSKDTAPSKGMQQSRRDEVEAEKFMNQPCHPRRRVSANSLVVCQRSILTWDDQTVFTG